MHRYAANVSMVFVDLPFLRRFDAAAAAGFETVEFHWPSAEQLAGRSLGQLARLIRSTGLQVGLFNLDGGDFSAGWRGLAGVPEARAAFRANLPVAVDLAVQLGCKKVNALAGNAVSDQARPAQVEILVDGLAEAAEFAAPADVSVALEALNPHDFPDYLVPNSTTALGVVSRTGRPNVSYQLDVYHAVAAGEDVVAVIQTATGRIGHVQFADFPGRREPGTGSLDWADILRALDDAGYDDWIGLEYNPTDPASRDFGFVNMLGGAPLRGRR